MVAVALLKKSSTAVNGDISTNNAILGDRCIHEDLVIKRALAVILYASGKALFTMLGHILGFHAH